MSIKIICKNKRAGYDYFLEEKLEAGLQLQGTEVKSLRVNGATMAESYVTIDRANEAWIYNLKIPHYQFGNIMNHEETRKRKLLLHASEIKKLKDSMAQKGLTLIPTILYFKNSLIKIEIALAKGKKLYDKREDKAKKDVERKLRQAQYD
jgi:SsrA-binding protein